MPRVIINATPIKLKTVLQIAKISENQFVELLKKYDIHTSNTSIGYLLGSGVMLKKVPNFKERLTEIITAEFGYILTAKKMNPAEIWDADFEEDKKEEDLFDEYKLLKKYMEVVMLNQGTLQHFGLKQNPFSLDIRKESDIYLAAPHAFALEVMKEAAEYGGFAVITGQVGSGKTTVLSKFIEEVKANNKYHIIYPEAIDKTRLTAKSILQACVFDLTETQPKAGIEALSRQVKKLLTNRATNNEKTLLIIEEAHDLPVMTLKFLKRIWEMRDGLTRLLGVILVGQNELETRLFGVANTDLREVTSRVTHAKVNPIDTQVADYINHRIKSVKGDTSKIITTDGIKAIELKLSKADRFGRKLSFAYPLAINNLMVRLMNYVEEHGEKIINKDVVEEINIGD